MNDVKKQIEGLIMKDGAVLDSNDAMKFAQAALNASNAMACEWMHPVRLSTMRGGGVVIDAAMCKLMVDRFLRWKLPLGFAPDAGIKFDKPSYMALGDDMPTGTNLFSADQAAAMVRFMITGMTQ